MWGKLLTGTTSKSTIKLLLTTLLREAALLTSTIDWSWTLFTTEITTTVWSFKLLLLLEAA